MTGPGSPLTYHQKRAMVQITNAGPKGVPFGANTSGIRKHTVEGLVRRQLAVIVGSRAYHWNAFRKPGK